MNKMTYQLMIIATAGKLAAPFIDELFPDDGEVQELLYTWEPMSLEFVELAADVWQPFLAHYMASRCKDGDEDFHPPTNPDVLH